jgi:hypothetical protein
VHGIPCSLVGYLHGQRIFSFGGAWQVVCRINAPTLRSTY